MTKVYMLPTPTQALTDTTNSIHQIVLKLQQHLPAYGVELTENRSEADLVVSHAGQTDGIAACDVAHTHGLYPTADHPETAWHWAANTTVINNVMHAKRVTAPSQWVADIFRRDMHINPDVIGWAIDPAEWEPVEHQGYVLWNKTRADGVCDPAPMLELAKRANRQLFLTTFGEGTPNVKAVGRQPFPAMKELIRHAQVYLATTKETFGIGTLEAMVCGVPVLGYEWGATAELVKNGVTGYLVKPGDIEGLLAGLAYCIANRVILGENARQVAQQYTWDKVAQQFAALYHEVLATKPSEIKVSVIIPCYNYAQYVEQAIKSALSQQTAFKFEVIVVNDGSTDNSQQVIKRLLPKQRGLYLITQPNSGVAEARNAGIKAAHGEYVVCLDADDMFGDPHFLQILADALDADPALGITFTGLQLVNEDTTQWCASKWPDGFDYEQQLVGRNQVPTCCMFRREAWQRAGGYRKRYTPAEDAELWTRIGSLGYGARQVTSAPMFWYRWHAGSLSAPQREGKAPDTNWRDKGWIETGKRPLASLGNAPHGSWPVRNYDNPLVSVIVPVGPYHRDLLGEALDSIEAQTETQWEIIVVNDSGKPLDLTAYPFVRLVNTAGKQGASFARNRGVEAARAPLVAFLDADDVFDMHFLEKTIREYQRTGRYIYTDWISLNKEGQYERHETPEYVPGEIFKRTSIHSINVAIPRSWMLDKQTMRGRFDETMQTWEDVDLFMQLATQGYCGARLPEALITYRYGTGKLREAGEPIKEQLKALLRSRYADYMEGKKVCGCAEPGLTAGESKAKTGNMIRVEYLGPRGFHSVIGVATKTSYGRREGGDIFLVDIADVRANPEAYRSIVELSPVLSTPIPPAPEALRA